MTDELRPCKCCGELTIGELCCNLCIEEYYGLGYDELHPDDDNDDDQKGDEE